MPLPPSQNYLTDNEDLLWHLEHSVDWDAIVRLVEADFTLPDGPESVTEARELYRDILEEVGRFVAKEVAPRAEGFDRDGARLEDGKVVLPEGMERLIQTMKRMDLMGLNLPRELGGMNAPIVLSLALSEMMARADCGVLSHFSFFGPIGLALLSYSAKEGSLEVTDGQVTGGRFTQQIRELARGDAWGAMVLTEPAAGSDLAAIRTRGTKGADGRWRLCGEKIFITSGHGQHQLVLARTQDPTGDPQRDLRGLSLFWVPRFIERDGTRIENVKVTKVEEKLGHHSSPTVSLLYEDSEAELIGRDGQGFELMLTLMNNARIFVGFEGLGLCEAAYRMAVRYASERTSMGKRLCEHELMADMLEEMDTDIHGLRALGFEAASTAEIAGRLELDLLLRPPADPEERRRQAQRLKRLQRKGRKLTPLLKYLAAEKAVEITRKNMQVHGGMGYMCETGADRLLRDALVLPIYEGTSQIQALMALKDHLGYAIKDPAAFVRKAARARVLAQTSRGLDRARWQAEAHAYRSIESIVARIIRQKLRAEWSEQLAHGSLLDRLRYLRKGFFRTWDPKRDFAHGLVHAERLSRMLADVAIARVLCRQAKEHKERQVYARRYLRRMLPRVTALAMEIQGGADLEDLMTLQAEEQAA